MAMITAGFVIIANVNSAEEWGGRNICRDTSGEVEYYRTIEDAIAQAIDMQDRCRSPLVSYTVEER